MLLRLSRRTLSVPPGAEFAHLGKECHSKSIIVGITQLCDDNTSIAIRLLEIGRFSEIQSISGSKMSTFGCLYRFHVLFIMGRYLTSLLALNSVRGPSVSLVIFMFVNITIQNNVNIIIASFSNLKQHFSVTWLTKDLTFLIFSIFNDQERTFSPIHFYNCEGMVGNSMAAHGSFNAVTNTQGTSRRQSTAFIFL